MTSWDGLDRELDAWANAGRRATLWWRDDDAVEPTPALARLLALGRNQRVPLAIAVIPARALPGLAAVLLGHPTVTPVQHGYAHRNHGAAGAKRGELGAARPLAARERELGLGRRLMGELFGPAALAVLVPPWNRIDPALIARLPRLGFRGLSSYGPRAAAEPAPGLIQVNTHLDIIDWRGSRGFVGEEKALGQLIAHLCARRTRSVDPAEPTGLLTHHLAHDAGAWDFVAALLPRIMRHRAARRLAPSEAFAAPRAARAALAAHP